MQELHHRICRCKKIHKWIETTSGSSEDAVILHFPGVLAGAEADFHQ